MYIPQFVLLFLRKKERNIAVRCNDLPHIWLVMYAVRMGRVGLFFVISRSKPLGMGGLCDSYRVLLAQMIIQSCDDHTH